MNFLQVHTTDNSGGAAICMYRFHLALQKFGHGSRLLCGRKYSDDLNVASLIPGRYGWVMNRVVERTWNMIGLQSFGNPSGLFLKKNEWLSSWADVAILRNVHGGYLSIGMLLFIAEHVPVIWHLPDMWPFTGHCAYAYDCKRWEIGCGKCPRLSDYPELLIDTTRFLWKRKKRLYDKIRNRLVLVSPSQWLRRQIERSPMMKNLRCVVIPTAVDMEVFRPGLRQESRKSLGIASSERVIMVSAFDMKEARKGGADIVSMLALLVRRYAKPITVLAVGYHSEKFLIPKGIRMVSTGFLNDDYMLSACYNAADVYVSLSHADNLPNTLIEAAACGIPIVCRDVGGCTEAIVPGVSGYAVADAQEAAVAVERLLRDKSYNSIFSAAAREHAQKYFSMDSQVLAYTALANDIAERIR